MVLGERDQKVQTFPFERAQEPLTEGVGLGTPHGVLDPQPQVAHTLVERLGEDRITVMDQKAVGVFGRNRFAELLHRPWGRGVCGHIRVEDAAREMCHHDKHVEEAKGRRDHHAEITRDDGLGMIAHKRLPALRRDT